MSKAKWKRINLSRYDDLMNASGECTDIVLCIRCRMREKRKSLIWLAEIPAEEYGYTCCENCSDYEIEVE